MREREEDAQHYLKRYARNSGYVGALSCGCPVSLQGNVDWPALWAATFGLHVGHLFQPILDKWECLASKFSNGVHGIPLGICLLSVLFAFVRSGFFHCSHQVSPHPSNLNLKKELSDRTQQSGIFSAS